MQYLQGNNRNQVNMVCFEELIPADSFVRAVDVFVDAIDMKSFGFENTNCKEEGRPAYHPSDMMKLYLYGYRYGIKTTRKLEREAKTNIEAIWLLKGLRPHYKTIANFRKDNRKAFRAVFRSFVLLLKEMDLIDGDTVAIDSFKIRASNSLKKNFNHKKLDRHLQYIDDQIAQYEKDLEEIELLENKEEEERKQELETKLKQRKEKKQEYTEIKKTLTESGQEQISLTDPDARSVVLHRNIINVGYNIQATCDAKHKMLVDYDTGTVNDTHALGPMALACKELLKKDSMNVLADKGYHTGKQLRECHNNGITTFISPKAPATDPEKGIPITMFYYRKEEDTYTCPEGHTMHSNGKWYKHSDSRPGRTDAHLFKRYLTPHCKACPSRHKCTSSKKNGRAIDRSEFADDVEANNERVNNNPEYYRQRQQITEHQFGTLKRQMGYDHTNVRGKPKVMGELGLLFTVYNLVRCVNILGRENFAKALQQRLCEKMKLKYGAFSAILRNYLFLLYQNVIGMSTTTKPSFAPTATFTVPTFGVLVGCCTDSRWL